VGPPDDGGVFKKVIIRPAVDFSRLEEVLCVIERPGAPPVKDALSTPQEEKSR
jgi:cell shape-determining protein MreC